MPVVFKRGKELSGTDGLTITVKDSNGSLIDPNSISYNIYDFTTGSEVLLPPSNRVPVRHSTGFYYASFMIPINANLGDYRIRWNFKKTQMSQYREIVQDFAIYDDDVKIVNLPGSSTTEFELVKTLRNLLRDNNPGRNYMFGPPSGEETMNQYNRVFGFVWEDSELLEFLNVSMDAINMYPPATDYQSIDSMIMDRRGWRTLILTGAMVYALNAMAINMVHEDFSYNIGGISLDMDKFSKYQSLAGDSQTRFNEFVVASKETVKVIKGLRQSRYGVGIRSSFGPAVGRGTLTPAKFRGIW